MAKIETIKDLMIAGEVSLGDMARLARLIFNGASTPKGHWFDGYDVSLPQFNDLPDREKSYLIKVLLECPVQNILDREAEELDGQIDTEMGPENTELDSELLD